LANTFIWFLLSKKRKYKIFSLGDNYLILKIIRIQRFSQTVKFIFDGYFKDSQKRLIHFKTDAGALVFIFLDS